MSVKIQLLLIDPQNDFVHPQGSLSVKGANADMDRAAYFIEKMGERLEDIHTTTDQHHRNDIAHPTWFRHVETGKPPMSFTQMRAEGSKIFGYMGQNCLSEFTTAMPSAFARTIDYLRKLSVSKRYAHTIWPIHCPIGEEGAVIWPAVSAALAKWTETCSATVDFVSKGSNPWTEHFSAVQAEVPDPHDPSTQLNTGLIRTLEAADVVLLAGEALDFCLANTVRDVANNFSNPKLVEKLVLLRDLTSPVSPPGGEKLGDDFIRELSARGMKVTDSKQFLATL